MALDLTVETRINGSLTPTTLPDVGSTLHTFDSTIRKVWTTGVPADQVDFFWSDERLVTTGATDSIDVAGSLTSLLGGTVTFARIKGILLLNSQNSGVANTTALSLARPGANGVPIFDAASDQITISPGGRILLENPSAAGWAVTAGTGDLISVVNAAGASNTYRIFIWGGLS